MAVSLKTDLRFPEPGQQGHGGRIIHVVLTIFSKEQMVHGTEFLWGILLTFLCFAIMQRTVIAIFGLGYKDMIANMKKKVRGTVEH